LSVATKLHATFHLLNSTVFALILVMALLSVPMVGLRAHRAVFEPAFRLAAGFVLTLLPLGYFYYTAWQRAGPHADRWFMPTFGLFLALSMGLTLRNAQAVLQGFLGRASPFVRTPKLGTSHSPARPAHRYRLRETGQLPFAEGLLTLYFLAGLGAGFYYRSYDLVPFHVLLVTGFGTLTGYILRQRLASY
jgi:hypothetical protein